MLEESYVWGPWRYVKICGQRGRPKRREGMMIRRWKVVGGARRVLRRPHPFRHGLRAPECSRAMAPPHLDTWQWKAIMGLRRRRFGGSTWTRDMLKLATWQRTRQHLPFYVSSAKNLPFYEVFSLNNQMRCTLFLFNFRNVGTILFGTISVMI